VGEEATNESEVGVDSDGVDRVSDGNYSTERSEAADEEAERSTT
jgi:hypothetical protein